MWCQDLLAPLIRRIGQSQLRLQEMDMTSIGENGSENSHSGEEAPGVRRAKRFKALAYVILCLSIISALTCGAALAALATHGRGNDSSEFEVFAITGVAFIVLGVLAGYAFAASMHVLIGVLEESRNLPKWASY